MPWLGIHFWPIMSSLAYDFFFHFYSLHAWPLRLCTWLSVRRVVAFIYFHVMHRNTGKVWAMYLCKLFLARLVEHIFHRFRSEPMSVFLSRKVPWPISKYPLTKIKSPLLAGLTKLSFYHHILLNEWMNELIFVLAVDLCSSLA